MEIQIAAPKLAKLSKMGSLSEVYLDKALRFEQQRAADSVSTKATTATSQRRGTSPLLTFLFLLSGSEPTMSATNVL